ncbi:hypothetical protein ACFLZW_02685 [Chloroflexota bacterium]
MNFSDSLLRISIKNWAAHQQPPERDLDHLMRQARFSNAVLKHKSRPRRASDENATRLKRPSLSLEHLLGPLTLMHTDSANQTSNLSTHSW